MKTEKRKKGLWIISGVTFALISMGPVLKIFGEPTTIPLPDYFLYQLPLFDLFRAIGRASLYVIFAASILAAYGLNVIFKLTTISKNIKISIAIIFVIVIFVSSLGLPYPTASFVTVPDYYYTIADDPRDVAILDVPLGRGPSPISDGQLFDDWQQFQIIHGKPYYGGHQSRVPDETQSYVRTYFLNQFIGDQNTSDIVTQDIKEVGISILNHLNIGYVILHYPPYSFFDPWYPDASKTWFPQTKLLLSEIFSKPPDFDDLKPSTKDKPSIIGYSVPASISQNPFILLSDGWGYLRNDARLIGDFAEIQIINPSDKIKKVDLNLELSSLLKTELKLLLNQVEISRFNLNDATSYQISSGSLELIPGTNTVTIISKNTLTPTKNLSPKMLIAAAPHLRGDLSILVTNISLDSNTTTNPVINLLEDNVISTKEILIEIKINDLYMKILKRPVSSLELINAPPKVLSGELTYDRIEKILKNSDEYKRVQLRSLLPFD